MSDKVIKALITKPKTTSKVSKQLKVQNKSLILRGIFCLSHSPSQSQYASKVCNWLPQDDRLILKPGSLNEESHVLVFQKYYQCCVFELYIIQTLHKTLNTWSAIFIVNLTCPLKTSVTFQQNQRIDYYSCYHYTCCLLLLLQFQNYFCLTLPYLGKGLLLPYPPHQLLDHIWPLGFL